jgi:metal-responsive CopG/Arc/MetJ family transcriptional regulator
MTENKKCISLWLDNDLVDAIDKHKIDRRFPTRKFLIDSVLRTYMNHVEIQEGIVRDRSSKYPNQ